MGKWSSYRAEAVMKYARDKGIKELYSFTSENNLPSRKVMEKLGMTFRKF